MLSPPDVATPSPRWPTWSMTRRSVSATARPEEEFDVAVAAGNGGRKHLDVGAAEESGKGRDIVADLLMHYRVLDDAMLGVFPLGLELRLDQRQQMRRCRCQRQRHRQHGFQRNETDVDDDDVGPRRQPLAFVGADIRLFHRHDVGMVLQRVMQLAVADVDGENDAGAVRQQHLGEAAGGGADVEADMAFDIDRILFQRAGELDAAAGYPGVGGLRGNLRVRSDRLRCLQNLLAAGDHEAGLDRGAGAGAAFEQAALDQQHVRALAQRGFAVVLVSHVQPVLPDVRPAARTTQASNEVRSCQMSDGACRGVTSLAPCRSSVWIIMRLSGQPKFSTVRPSLSVKWPSVDFVTAPNRLTRST